MKKKIIAYCFANGYIPYYSGNTQIMYITKRVNTGLRDQILKEFGELKFKIEFQYD